MPVFGRGPKGKASKQQCANPAYGGASGTTNTTITFTDHSERFPHFKPPKIPAPPKQAQSDRCDECGRDVPRGEQCVSCSKAAWAKLQSNLASPPRRRGAAFVREASRGPSNTLVAPPQSGHGESSNGQQQDNSSYKDLLQHLNLNRESPVTARRNTEDLKTRSQKLRSPTKPRVAPSLEKKDEEHHRYLDDVLTKSIREAEARMGKGNLRPR